MFSGPQLWQKSSALPEVKLAPGTTGKTSPADNPMLPHNLPSFPSPLSYYPYPGPQLQQKPIALLETMWVLKISVRRHQNYLTLPQSLPSFLNSAHSPTYPGPQLWQKPIVLLEAMIPLTSRSPLSVRTPEAKPVPQVSETPALPESTPFPRIPCPRGNANHPNSREVILQATQNRRPEKKWKPREKIHPTKIISETAPKPIITPNPDA